MLEEPEELGKQQATIIGSTNNSNNINNNNMAAPLKPKQIADQRIDDNENANSKNTQQQTSAQNNCVVKLRRRAPQVPQRNPNTALSRAGYIHTTENQDKKDNDDDKIKRIQNPKLEEIVEHMEQDGIDEKMKLGDGEGDEDEDGEESIYQPIWQFKTLEPILQHLPNLRLKRVTW
ncbi:uncharacterized protein Dwil_GK27739 [Drosophila willistoni]|uniref:Uncharacterized protein n=1 Tax=Drosophila willistoni TaxID=7260 RepID=A0A0Q9WU92_DROWI|nr:uncharacterized protein Dwil_GK27739 [Drosophila willistoni]